jgi:hypothetical protein
MGSKVRKTVLSLSANGDEWSPGLFIMVLHLLKETEINTLNSGA